MKKRMMAWAVAVLAVSPWVMAQDAPGGAGARGGRPGAGPGAGAGAGGAAMQERMKEAWGAMDKEACFRAMDANADGAISQDEFTQADLQAVFGTALRDALMKRGAGAGAGAGAGFAVWDKNADGKVVAEEFPRGEEAFKKLLERADKDGDGALTAEEVRAFREAAGPGRPERPGRPGKAERPAKAERPGKPAAAEKAD